MELQEIEEEFNSLFNGIDEILGKKGKSSDLVEELQLKNESEVLSPEDKGGLTDQNQPGPREIKFEEKDISGTTLNKSLESSKENEGVLDDNQPDEVLASEFDQINQDPVISITNIVSQRVAENLQKTDDIIDLEKTSSFSAEIDLLKKIINSICHELSVEGSDDILSIPVLENPELYHCLQTDILQQITHLKKSQEKEILTSFNERLSKQNNNKSHTSPSQNHLNWIECTEENPPPPFGLDSPVIYHLFSTWTTDQNKIDFLHAWIHSLEKPPSPGYPLGIQITSVSQVLRDAFVILVIPLMRKLSIDPLVVWIREHELEIIHKHHEHQNPGEEDLVDFSDSEDGNNKTPIVNTDPFVDSEHLVYDIRVKRHAPNTSSKETEFEVIEHLAEKRSISQGYRTDSVDYSPLAEINEVFKDIPVEVGDVPTDSLTNLPPPPPEMYSLNQMLPNIAQWFSTNIANTINPQSSFDPNTDVFYHDHPKESIPTTIPSLFNERKPSNVYPRQSFDSNTVNIPPVPPASVPSSAPSSATKQSGMVADKINARLEALRKK